MDTGIAKVQLMISHRYIGMPKKNTDSQWSARYRSYTLLNYTLLNSFKTLLHSANFTIHDDSSH